MWPALKKSPVAQDGYWPPAFSDGLTELRYNFSGAERISIPDYTTPTAPYEISVTLDSVQPSGNLFNSIKFLSGNSLSITTTNDIYRVYPMGFNFESVIMGTRLTIRVNEQNECMVGVNGLFGNPVVIQGDIVINEIAGGVSGFISDVKLGDSRHYPINDGDGGVIADIKSGADGTPIGFQSSRWQ